MALPKSQMEEIVKRAQNRINEYLGSDLDNLKSLTVLHDEWNAKRKEAEQSLSLTSNEVTSKVGKITKFIESSCSELSTNCQEISMMLAEISKETCSTDDLYLLLKENFDKINHLTNAHAYLSLIDFVEHLSNRMEGYVANREINTGRAIDEYKKLGGLCVKINKTSCNHLRMYLIDTLKYWHGILKKDIIDEFVVYMKNVQWPIVSTNNLLSAPTADALSKFQHGLKRLLQIAVPLGNLKGGVEDLKHHKYFKSIQWLSLVNKKIVSPFIPHVASASDVSNFQRVSDEPLQIAELDNVLVSSSLVVTFPTPTLPVVLLIQPLRKRFVFHFSGNSKTNRIDKPEWYFTQVLTWIRDHENFLLTWVQPVYDDMDIGKSSLAEFMGGLVELSLEKLQADIELAQYDDMSFSHIVDEALAYERELRQTYFYPQTLPGPVHILSQAQLFVKWLSMEKKFAREKMDMMIKSETAWSTMAGDSDEDMVTEVAHSFLALLSTMSDRYSLLPQPGHRLQFVELILEIIDDLRISLLQVLHTEHTDPLNSKLPQILNTVHHIRIAIEQYDASPSILLLSHYRMQYSVIPREEGAEKSRVNPVDEPTGGIFLNALDLLERLEHQLLGELCDNLMMEVKAKSRPYRKDKWYGMTQDDVDSGIVTLSGCGMYQALADQLHLVHGKITEKLFSSFWKMVANNICLFFLEEIVLDNYFNHFGGQVLEKDVNKFLIPLFQHYSDVPGTYFVKLQEACRILSLPLLSPTAKRAAAAGNAQELIAALDFPLIHVTGERLCTVITRRIDVVPSLM